MYGWSLCNTGIFSLRHITIFSHLQKLNNTSALCLGATFNNKIIHKKQYPKIVVLSKPQKEYLFTELETQFLTLRQVFCERLEKWIKYWFLLLQIMWTVRMNGISKSQLLSLLVWRVFSSYLLWNAKEVP